MILLFFVILAPLLSFRWRRFAAFGAGVFAEMVSPAPFGVILGLFFFIVFFVELLEQRLVVKETMGWFVVALGAAVIAALGEAIFVIMFDHASFPLAAALFISKLIVAVFIISFFWMPVKLHLAHFKQR